MVFWTAVFIGLVTAYLGVRKGFFETLVLSVNLCLAVYLSVFLTPVIATIIPAATDLPGGVALTAGLLAIGGFLLLHTVSWLLFTAEFKVPFPKVFDVLISGGIGFLTGFLAASFIAMILTLVPQVQGLLRDGEMTFNRTCVCNACDRIHALVRGSHEDYDSDRMLRWLGDKASDQARPSVAPKDPNRPGPSAQTPVSDSRTWRRSSPGSPRTPRG